MPFAQGKQKTGGRSKGVSNRATAKVRALFGQILDDNLPQLRKDISDLEPKERARVLLKLAEFCVPRLQAVEVTNDEERFDINRFINAPVEQRVQILREYKNASKENTETE